MNRIHVDDIDKNNECYSFLGQIFTGTVFDTVGYNIIYEAEIVDGKLHGWARHWDLHGEIILEVKFIEGSPANSLLQSDKSNEKNYADCLVV